MGLVLAPRLKYINCSIGNGNKMSFLKNTLKFFDECYIAYAERFAPYFVYSACCHMFNLANQKREFWFMQGKLAQARLHLYMVAPPGFTKTAMLQRFLVGPNSIVGCTADLGENSIECGFEGSQTEAGFVGTFKAVQGGGHEVVYGAAHEHRNGIMGIDEFSALANMMKVEHSMNLDNAMLLALDSGWCIKRLAPGKIEYMTNVTLQTGSQPGRFNLASGLGRRLNFLKFIPTFEEMQVIKETMRKGKNARPNYSILSQIKSDVEKIQMDLQNVEKITVDKSFYQLMDDLRVPHMEEILYERMAIGFYLAYYNGCDKTLEVHINSELKRDIKRAVEWRRDIKKGAETDQIFQVCKELDGCAISEVKQRLTDFGIEYKKSQYLIEELHKQGRIEIVIEKNSKGRPAQIVIAKY